jgi:serine/threonine protein kinase
MQSRKSSKSELHAGALVAPSALPGSLADHFHLRASIGGQYIIERPLSEGAMSMVVVAQNVSLGEPVAIKFLRPELRRDASALVRLAREARVLLGIQNEHVVRVLDVGAISSVGPYMVMEYLDGANLSELLASGPLPVPLAVEYILQTCEALAVAHASGIVHRDLKPENLFLARQGSQECIKVLDFGICDDGAPDAPPDSDALIGTPPYMSPERVLGAPRSDQRCDIWSLGVSLHQLVTGRTPFEGASDEEICRRIAHGAPPALVLDESVLPRALRAVISRCLQRKPEQRYQCVEELVAALIPHATLQPQLRARFTGSFPRSPRVFAGVAPRAAAPLAPAPRSPVSTLVGALYSSRAALLDRAAVLTRIVGGALRRQYRACVESSRALSRRVYTALFSRRDS